MKYHKIVNKNNKYNEILLKYLAFKYPKVNRRLAVKLLDAVNIVVINILLHNKVK